MLLTNSRPAMLGMKMRTLMIDVKNIISTTKVLQHMDIERYSYKILRAQVCSSLGNTTTVKQQIN